MYCPECGMLNEESRRYCVQCGTRLDILTSTPAPTVTPEDPEPAQEDVEGTRDSEAEPDNPYAGLADEDYEIGDDEEETDEEGLREADASEDTGESQQVEETEVDEDLPAEEVAETEDKASEDDLVEEGSFEEEPEHKEPEEQAEPDEQDVAPEIDEPVVDGQSSEEPEGSGEAKQDGEQIPASVPSDTHEEPEASRSKKRDALPPDEAKEPLTKSLSVWFSGKMAERKERAERERRRREEAAAGNIYIQEPTDKRLIVVGCVVALAVCFGAVQLFLAPPTSAASDGVQVSEGAPVVHFEKGTADGGVMTPLRVEVNQSVTVPKCGFINSGHAFLGWRDPEAHLLLPGTVIRVTSDITLTAVWDTDQRAISFNAAGGDGTMETLHIPRGIAFTVPKCSYVWDGHFFSYWITNSGVTYLPGDVFVVDGDLELTAVWDVLGAKSEQVAAAEVEAPAGILSADTFPNLWSGSFEVHSDAVEGGAFWRSCTIELSEHNPDGLVAGAVTVGVLDDVVGAASGSYYVQGIIDWNTGQIELVGTGWADQGTLTDMGGFRGTVDPATRTMNGEWFDPNNIVLPGLWQMVAM